MSTALRRRVERVARKRPHAGQRLARAVTRVLEPITTAVEVVKLAPPSDQDSAPFEADEAERWPQLHAYLERLFTLELPDDSVPTHALDWHVVSIPTPTPEAVTEARDVLAIPLPDADAGVQVRYLLQWWAAVTLDLTRPWPSPATSPQPYAASPRCAPFDRRQKLPSSRARRRRRKSDET